MFEFFLHENKSFSHVAAQVCAEPSSAAVMLIGPSDHPLIPSAPDKDDCAVCGVLLPVEEGLWLCDAVLLGVDAHTCFYITVLCCCLLTAS